MRALLLYIGNDLEADMAPFDEQRELPPHEVVLDSSQVEHLHAVCSDEGTVLEQLDPAALSDLIAEAFSAIAGRRDGEQFFATTSENTDGRFDYYGPGPPLLKLKAPRKRLLGLVKKTHVHKATLAELDAEAFSQLQTGAVLRDGVWHAPSNLNFDAEKGTFMPEPEWAAEYTRLTTGLAPADTVELVSYHY